MSASCCLVRPRGASGVRWISTLHVENFNDRWQDFWREEQAR